MIRYDMSSTNDDQMISVAMRELKDSVVQSTTLWQINTRDQLIREELIRMGWTPPPDVAAQTPETS